MTERKNAERMHRLFTDAHPHWESFLEDVGVLPLDDHEVIGE